MHARDIASTLEHLRDAFGQEGIPFGIIGALALPYYGYERFTEDIDIVTTREGLDRIHERLVGLGLRPRGPGLRKKLRHIGFKVDIDVVTAGEHAGSAESPVVFPDPTSAAFVDQGGLRVVVLEKLIELKIASGMWGKRDQDLVDVQKVIRANRLTESFADRFPNALKSVYLDLLARSREERDLEE